MSIQQITKEFEYEFAPLSKDSDAWLQEERRPLSRILEMDKLNAAVNGCTPNSKNAEFGFEANTFNLITAETGTGKSTFLIHTLGSFLLENERCLFYSLEMDRAQVLSQFWSWYMHSFRGNDFPEWKIRKYQRVLSHYAKHGTYPSNIESAYLKEVKEMKDIILEHSKTLPVEFFWGSESVCLEDSIQDITRAMDKATTEQEKVRHVFFDHLGVLKTKKQFANSIQKEGYILEYLETLWKKYDVTVWLAVQFSKGSNRGGKSSERTAQDVSGTAAIPNLAYNIIYLYTTAEQDNLNRAEFQDNKRNKYLTLKLLKARTGKIGFTENVVMNVDFKTFREQK